MPNEQYARPRRNVAIIRHIDEQLIQYLILDPLMKDGNKVRRIDRQVALYVDLYVDVLQLHRFRYLGSHPSLRYADSAASMRIRL